MFLLNEGVPQTNQGVELLETSMNGFKMPVAKIRTVLQTLDDVNKNRRIYPKALFERSLKDVIPLLESGAWVGELDHPLITGNDQVDSLRHFLVLYDRTSHKFNKVFIDGTTVMGEVETTLTECGFNMAGLIMSKVPVGFSLRAMGETKSRRDGVTEIAAPFNIITFDCVSNPSHAKARMVEVVTESAEGLTESAKFNPYKKEQIAFDRSNWLYNIKKMPTVESMLRDLEISVAKHDLREAEKTMDKLGVHYVQYDSDDMSVVNMLDEFYNGGAPIEYIVRKYVRK